MNRKKKAKHTRKCWGGGCNIYLSNHAFIQIVSCLAKFSLYLFTFNKTAILTAVQFAPPLKHLRSTELCESCCMTPGDTKVELFRSRMFGFIETCGFSV